MQRLFLIDRLAMLVVGSIFTSSCYAVDFLDDLFDSEDQGMHEQVSVSQEGANSANVKPWMRSTLKKAADKAEAKSKAEQARERAKMKSAGTPQRHTQGSLFDQLGGEDAETIAVPVIDEPVSATSKSAVIEEGRLSNQNSLSEEEYSEMVKSWNLPTLDSCQAKTEPQYLYRKRVGVVAFNVNDHKSAADLPFIERDYAKALFESLDRDRFILTDAIHTRLLEKKDAGAGYDVPSVEDQIVSLAKELNVQFIVAGKIVDVSTYEGKTDIGRLFQGLPHLGVVDPKRFFRKVDGDGRQLVVELQIYDGLNGTSVYRDIFPVAIDGEYLKHTNVAMRHASFLTKGEFGEAAVEMLEKQAFVIADELTCLPMASTIRRVNKALVHINVSVENKIIPGDRFKVFRRVVIGTNPSGQYEFDFEYHGHLTVTRVGPTKSMGILDRGFSAYELNPGDIVQAW
ncbi:MAG: hypothetical protein K6L73_12355 [Cellvibrionaceae bacterium]